MIESLTVADLSRRCAEETARYLRREPSAERFCLELWRRAVVRRDDDAWSAIYAQYEGMVRRWLNAPKDEEDEDVPTAFARFWHAVDSAKFAGFSSLAAVMQYLKMCAVTVRLERARRARSTGRNEPLDEQTNDVPDPGDMAGAVLARLDAAALWGLVNEVLRDELEHRVIYLSFVLGLTPREICARYGAQFASAGEVYRLKGAAIGKLRRASRDRALV
jgi:hypothetical protein